MKLYVVMLNDRHIDPEPFVFDTPEAAIETAQRLARENGRHPDSYQEESPPDGWLFYARYSVEDDSVWVIEKELNKAD